MNRGAVLLLCFFVCPTVSCSTSAHADSETAAALQCKKCKGSSAKIVYDGAGNALGGLVSFAPYELSWQDDNGLIWTFDSAPTYFWGPTANLDYATMDCTGTPYLPNAIVSNMVVYMNTANQLYKTVGSPTSVVLNSFLADSGCVQDGTSYNAMPLQLVASTLPAFPPLPLTIK